MIVDPAQTVVSIALLALLLELLVGWPSWLFSLIGHPVSWLGHVIDQLESWFRSDVETAPGKELFTGVLLVIFVLQLTTRHHSQHLG